MAGQNDISMAQHIERMIPLFNRMKWKMAAIGIGVGLVSGFFWWSSTVSASRTAPGSRVGCMRRSCESVADCSVGVCCAGGRPADCLDDQQ